MKSLLLLALVLFGFLGFEDAKAVNPIGIPCLNIKECPQVPPHYCSIVTGICVKVHNGLKNRQLYDPDASIIV
ncbi:hypothetical protein Ddc_11129 [Ditylenchus destructor]|nr:hypothetical protein Ddc_11129 [Ditylenchus destructor]